MEKTIIQFVQNAQAWFAVFVGVFVQFWFVDKEQKNKKIFYTITISSIFIAIYIIPALIDIVNMSLNINLEKDGDIAIMLYASSSLISMEIMSLLVFILPIKAKKKLLDVLEIEDDTNN